MRLKIGPHTYEVNEVEGLLRNHGEYGQWLGEALEINLDAGLLPTQRLRVLLHEIIRAIESNTGLDLGERTVDRLAVSLAGVIIDNDWWDE